MKYYYMRMQSWTIEIDMPASEMALINAAMSK